MVVKFNPSALRRTKWYEVVLRIIFGGLATVGTGLIAKEYGPVVGGGVFGVPRDLSGNCNAGRKIGRAHV